MWVPTWRPVLSLSGNQRNANGRNQERPRFTRYHSKYAGVLQTRCRGAWESRRSRTLELGMHTGTSASKSSLAVSSEAANVHVLPFSLSSLALTPRS